MNTQILSVGVVISTLLFGSMHLTLAQDAVGAEPVQWDVNKIRKGGDQFLFESIPKSDRRREAIEASVKKGEFPLEVEDLSDNEIKRLCDYRAVLRKRGEIIDECPRVEDEFKGIEIADFPGAEEGRPVLGRILRKMPIANGSRRGSASSSNRQVHWNVWMDHKKGEGLAFDPKRVLKPGHDYLLAIDLSAFRYDKEKGDVLTEDAGPAVVDLMSDPSKMPDELEIFLLHDKAYFDPPVKPDKPFKICKENIRNRANIKQEDKPYAARKSSTQECSPSFLFGHAFIPISTKKNVQGPTSLGLSIWAKKRPVDEVSLQICIAEAPSACKRLPAPKLSFKGIDSLRVGKESEFPDASLHFLVKDPNEGVIGVFRNNDKGSDGKFVAWPLGIPADDLLNKFNSELIPALERVANDPKSERDDLEQEARTIYEALFPLATVESKEARAVFEAFLSTYLEKDPLSPEYDPPSLFVRMISQGPALPLPIPLGLLPIKGKFLGDYFRIESPLEIQNYEPGEGCITNWILVAPSLLGPKDSVLREAFNTASGTLTALREGVDEKQDFDSIGNSESGFRPWIRQDDVKEGRSSALMVLSHHDSDSLYFEKSSDKSLLSDSINRDFKEPSVVILNGCGTGGGGGRHLIRRFNQKGFTTMIALSTQVGARLAGDYVGCLAAELQKNVDSKGNPKPKDEMASISRAHYRAITRCLSGKLDDKPKAEKYGARVLAYTLLGNGNLRICPPKKGVQP